MTLTKSDRAWILRQLRKTTTELRTAFDEAIREEAQLAVLRAMQKDDAPRPVA